MSMVTMPMEPRPHCWSSTHAERRAQGHGAIGADAVEGDDLGGVLGSGAGDAPER
jgi:hypothetical protein